VDRSFVVSGAARGIGRAIAERLARDGNVVAFDRDRRALSWTDAHARVIAVAGDAGDEADAAGAADAAERSAPLAGWVNNAAVFRDAALHEATAREVLELIGLTSRSPSPAARRRSATSARAAAAARSSTSPRTRRSGRCAARCHTRPQRPRSRA
jgi:NAD(P)-dependent dehydrogenase (short-subunit alcohol dehydrogenase family)